MISVKKIFNCLSGNSGLTEEFIYNSINKNAENYKVLSSSTLETTNLGRIPFCKDIKGDDISVFTDNMGILVARNGKAGKMTFLEQGNYTINDHAYILSLKNDFIKKYAIDTKERQEIFLKYYIYRYQHEVYSYSTNNDNSTWNKTGYFKHSVAEILSMSEMENIVNRYEDCIKYKHYVDEIDNKLNKLFAKTLSIDSGCIKEVVALEKVLSYISRNDSLSEEGIYNLPPEDNKAICVLSGSIKDINYGKINYATKVHKLIDRQALHLVTRGKAGKLTYLDKGTYATNTNAFILFIEKSRWKDLNISNETEEAIYLKYLMLYLQPIFYEVCSKSDVSVFPLTDKMKNLMIPKFSYTETMKDAIKIYDRALEYKKIIDSVRDKVDGLFDKQIIL